MTDTMPVGNPRQPEFKQKSLDQVFKFDLTRKQCIVLVNALRPIELPIGDLRSKVLREILETIEQKAIQSIRPSDYEQPTQPLRPTVTTK